MLLLLSGHVLRWATQVFSPNHVQQVQREQFLSTINRHHRTSPLGAAIPRPGWHAEDRRRRVAKFITRPSHANVTVRTWRLKKDYVLLGTILAVLRDSKTRSPYRLCIMICGGSVLCVCVCMCVFVCVDVCVGAAYVHPPLFCPAFSCVSVVLWHTKSGLRRRGNLFDEIGEKLGEARKRGNYHRY